jgi:A/G-specific adenine glycosylase
MPLSTRFFRNNRQRLGETLPETTINTEGGNAVVSGKGMHPVTKKVLAWYGTHKRDLPWRDSADPYHVWVSEVMLQQTQVETVIPYYHRFLSRFPTVQSLAAATQDEVLKAWENMGYYGRARHLHAAAGRIVERFGGEVPHGRDELMSLPGVGRYTAGAILSMAFGMPVPAVDANVRRVIIRLFAIDEPIDQSRTTQRVWVLAGDLVPSKGAGRFNQALMDLGATICRARDPKCLVCPAHTHCQACLRGVQQNLPLTGKRAPVPHHHVTAGIIRNDKGGVLVIQRLRDGLLGGLWKFPGGKQKKNESLEDCLQRETRREIGIAIRVGQALSSVKHAYTHFRITLHAFQCIHVAGNPKAMQCTDWQWIDMDRFGDLAFSKVDRKIIRALAGN